MPEDDFRIEMIGHASLRARSGGKTLVTDPWWFDPIAPHSAAHFPPLVHDLDAVARTTDLLYISHIHPDHFHRPTLERFSRSIPVFIGEHRRKGFRDAIAALGFTVVECPFAEAVRVPGTPFELTMIEHDYEENAAYDSSVVVRTPEYTLFNNNDCVLAPAKYASVRERYAVDYAFLGFSPASFFPICFEMDADEKRKQLELSAERRYRDFVDAASRLAPRVAIPFASGLRFLEDGERWKNIAFNSAGEAAQRLAGSGIRAEVMSPGDRIEADGTFRCRAVASKDDELVEIERYAQREHDLLCRLFPPDPPARPDLIDRFRDEILRLRRETRARLPAVSRCVIAFEIGDTRFHFDFSRPDEHAFGWGHPQPYDMLYRYPPAGVQRKLDGEIDWDDLHFSAGVSVHQVRYAKEYFMMLRSDLLDLD